jgi:hypothetical protein
MELYSNSISENLKLFFNYSLAALQNEIATAKGRGKNDTATEAENYLARLKSSDLKDENLDAVRSQIIDYILKLSPAQT